MKKAIPDEGRRSSQPLYPMLLAAFGIALLGAIWSLQGVEPPESQLDIPSWEEVSAFDSGELEPVLWEEPVNLAWAASGPVVSTLQMHQIDRRRGDDEARVDVRMEFRDVEETIDDGERQQVRRTLDARRVETRHDGDEVEPVLHRQLLSALRDVGYELIMDHRGRVDEVRWSREVTEDLAPAADLAVGMHRMLTPHFPDEPVLVGERWTYSVVLPVPAPGESPPVRGGIDVEDRLTGMYEGEHRRVAVINRQFSAGLVGEGTPGEPAMKLRGRGSVYFDVDAGRRVASSIELQRTSSAPAEAEGDEPIVTDIKAVWKAGETNTEAGKAP